MKMENCKDLPRETKVTETCAWCRALERALDEYEASRGRARTLKASRCQKRRTMAS
jgi:hypothetical protein